MSDERVVVPAMNIIDGIQQECNRCRELLKRYEEIAVLTMLEEAALFGVNHGDPQKLPADAPGDGWVSGLYLAMHGGGLRYGGRIHELRARGYEILTHEENVTDDEGERQVHSFYRLISEPSGAEGDRGVAPAAPLNPTAAMIAEDIRAGEAAIASGDCVAMVRALAALKGCK